MHFAPEAIPAEIPTHIRRFISITGIQPWRNRWKTIDRQLAENELLFKLISERFQTELALREVLEFRRQTNRLPWPPKTAEQHRALSFVTMASLVHQRLSTQGKKRLKGMLIHGLDFNYGLAPLVFEMLVATHLMQNEYEVNFHDIESDGRFDFLAEKNGVLLEVECKFISADIGRKIHQRRLYELSNALKPTLTENANRASGGLIVRVIINNRLTGEKRQHNAILNSITEAFSSKNRTARSESCTVEISSFELENSPFVRDESLTVSQQLLESYLSDELGIDNKNVFILMRPGDHPCVVVIESKKRDAVLKSITRQLKKSAKSQLSGKRPGMIWCYLADLTEKQLRQLADRQSEGTGLQFAVTEIFSSRPHLHTLAFSCEGSVRVQTTTAGHQRQTSVQESGGLYTFANSNHPDSERKDLRVFSRT